MHFLVGPLLNLNVVQILERKWANWMRLMVRSFTEQFGKMLNNNNCCMWIEQIVQLGNDY